VSREHIEHFVERLEGWWFGVIVKALTGVGSNAIPVLAIDNRLDELREEFRRNSLPVDYGGKTPPASVIAELDRRPFVRQLRRIEIGNMRVEYAIRDYYRASEQRSKWAPRGVADRRRAAVLRARIKWRLGSCVMRLCWTSSNPAV
jgi:hypothetical protein